MFLLLGLYYYSLFLKIGFLFANLGLYNCLGSTKSIQKSACLQFIDLSFLIVLELVHILLELSTLLLSDSLFVLRYLDSRSQISNRLFQLFYFNTELGGDGC